MFPAADLCARLLGEASMKAMAKMRADSLLVARGLSESRAKARAAIEAGRAFADGRQLRAPSELIEESAALVAEPAFPWVSRAGAKLVHGLNAFAVSPEGRTCLDIGASTGGFTEVLLARGAAKVYAVDVGAGQLHARLRAEPRVVSLERTDARALTSAVIPEPPSLVVCDVSFIGAAKALAVPLVLAAPRADLVALIKPQFEAGPRAGKAGVLDEEKARAAGAAAIAALDGLAGFSVLASCESPIRGAEGNLELLVHAQRR
jgi:23S rRNA (cytidine1920-2'-O)/16S rRNA (cytidine1409-2'-O)-methyltransferase